MTYNKKTIIQALLVVIFTVFLYREWNNFDARFFYIELLCFLEVVIQFIYLFFNRKTITVEQRDREKIAIILYLIVMVGMYLLNLIVVH